MRGFFLVLLFVSCVSVAQQPVPPIGMWREHLPYNSAIDVTAGDGRVFCATPYSLFTVTPGSNTIERWSRVTGLSETGISTIRYDAGNGKLVIAYDNSNLDIIDGNDIINIPDIKRDNIAGDKRIYSIFPFRQNYFLSTGLGVIVVDGERHEIKDSWFIGAGGNTVKTTGFACDGSAYYAATGEGLKKAAVNGPDPANFNNWQTISVPLPCQDVAVIGSQLFAQRNDTVFAVAGSSFSFLYSEGWSLISMQASGNHLLVCERSGQQGRVTILNSTGTVTRRLAQLEPISFPRRAILVDGDPWLADQFGGLTHFGSSSYDNYKPNSPEATGSGDITVLDGIVYATAGAVDDAWVYQYNGNGIFIFRDGQWTNINRFRFAQLDTLLDFITVAIDKSDKSAWAGSYGGGLLHIKPDQSFEIFKQNYIGPAIGDPSSYRVSGLAFDEENNLWIANYGSNRPLRVRTANGNWYSFAIPFSLAENSFSQVVIDDNNYKWIVASKTSQVICYDHGAAIESTGDDRWRMFGTGAGNGGLPAGEVLCLAKDKNGFIWVGTSNGIGVFQCTPDVFTGAGCEAIRPVVPSGNFAGYLFSGQEVRSIAVDGADRKWVATRNGVFLVSATGEKVVYQFTEDNSPLLSNDVRKIAIDGSTGEVWFATAKGTCSFRSTATEGSSQNQSVLVFPNPVPPGYSGTIGIRGLANNAIVKITEMNGRLVYQTRALGGQAVWDGRDYRGRKIGTGVYLVLVSEDGSSGSKKEQTAARIIFISN